MKAYAANTRLNEFEYRQGRIVLRSWPQVIDLGLTLKCNLRCEMCFSRKMAADDLDRGCLAKVIPYLDFCHRIVWNDAGELFASSRTGEFVELMKRYHPPVSYVSTNALLIDRYMDEILDSGLTDMSVSADAVRRETYERIRAGGRWEKLIANLELMQRKKAKRQTEWPRLTFVFVAMRSNLAELPEFVDFAGKYGGVSVHVLKMLATPTGLERVERPTFEEEKAAYKKALLRAREIGIQIEHTFFNNEVLLDEIARETAPTTPPDAGASDRSMDKPFPTPPPMSRRPLLEALHLRRFDPPSGNVPICPSPWREFLIQTDGKVRACCFSPAVMGDLQRQSVAEIWNGSEYQAFRRRLVVRDFSACAGCPYLAKILAVGGDPLEQSLVQLEREVAEQGRWLDSYLGDLDWLTEYLRGLRNGPVRTSIQKVGTAAGTLARLMWKNIFVKPALIRAWAESRRINRRLLETARLVQQRFRRSREDLEILAEVAALRAQQGIAVGDRPASALAVDEAQDPIDALFYSVRFVRHQTPERLRAGGETRVPITIMNTSAVEWPTEGDHAVKMAYSWYYANGALHLLDGLRTRVAPSPRPGQTADLQAVLRAPSRPGRYVLKWDLVYDPYAWFKDRGSLPLEIDVVIEPESHA
jgi:radical SAM protein with 4Fe4S-binding SPASM domain